MRFENGSIIFNKGDNEKLSSHFTTKEFECHCSNDDCKEQRVALELLVRLEMVRIDLGSPIKITSGFRCHKHQLALAAGGLETASGISSHEKGEAADIVSNDMLKLEGVVQNRFGELAIGIAKSFIHVDIRNDRPRRWTYQKT